MAKNKISEYSATSANNTDISNINIAEGCSPANVNNAIRTLMAQLKDQQDGTSGDPFTVGGNLVVTGTTTLTTALPITSGGTGSTTASGARSNLSAAASGANSDITSLTGITAGTATAPAFTTTGDTNTGMFFPAADTIAFAEGGTEVMRLDSSGRVGIGGTTVTDGHLLNIQGSSATNNIGVVLNKTNATAQIWGITNSGPLTFYDYTSSVERMRIASDGTVTIPKGVSGTPAFAAYQSTGVALTGATWTKITFQTEEYDTNSNFDTSRFTPTVAGYYQINGAWQFGTGGTVTGCAIYKNGTIYKQGAQTGGTSGYGGTVSSLVYFNGSSDYVELYGYASTAKTPLATIDATYFNGSLVRGA